QSPSRRTARPWRAQAKTRRSAFGPSTSGPPGQSNAPAPHRSTAAHLGSSQGVRRLLLHTPPPSQPAHTVCLSGCTKLRTQKGLGPRVTIPRAVTQLGPGDATGPLGGENAARARFERSE